MIEYTEDDFELHNILHKQSYMDDIDAKHNYHIFGLKLRNRPHVRLITRNPYLSIQLMALFTRSDLALDIVKDTSKEVGDKVLIGIRRDIRRHPFITRKLIKTIIYSLEGKLNLNNKFKINLGVNPGTTWNKIKDKSELEDTMTSIEHTTLENIQDTVMEWETTLDEAGRRE